MTCGVVESSAPHVIVNGPFTVRGRLVYADPKAVSMVFAEHDADLGTRYLVCAESGVTYRILLDNPTQERMSEADRLAAEGEEGPVCQFKLDFWIQPSLKEAIRLGHEIPISSLVADILEITQI